MKTKVYLDIAKVIQVTLQYWYIKKCVAILICNEYCEVVTYFNIELSCVGVYILSLYSIFDIIELMFTVFTHM